VRRRLLHFWTLAGEASNGWRSVAKVVVIYVSGETSVESMILVIFLHEQKLKGYWVDALKGFVEVERRGCLVRV